MIDAYSVPCPVCGRPIGQKCNRPRSRPKPHAERIAEAERQAAKKTDDGEIDF